MEIRKPMAMNSRIHIGETWSVLVFPGGEVGFGYLPVYLSAHIPQQTSSFNVVCQCHRTPALHQREFVHVVKTINNHVTKANKDDFSPKRIKTVNRRVNKSGYAVSLTSTLVLINVMYCKAMERNRHNRQKAKCARLFAQ